MAQLGKKSMKELSSCKRDIQTIFQEVVKFFDITVVEGGRTAERQNHHWAKGRVLKEGGDPKVRADWSVFDKSKIVTHKDGYEKLSKHQKFPSIAVDVVPYPEMWSNKNRFIELRGVVKFVQAKLLAEGRIEMELDNGADLWKGFDMPHWQEKNN